MKYIGRKTKRILALILVIAAVLPAAPAHAETYKAVAMGGPLTVYQNPTLTGKSVKLSAYAVVNVQATSGNVAQLVNGKNVGYVNARNLQPLSEVAMTAVSNRVTRIFQKPSTSSRSVAIPKGFRMNVLYYNSTYAIVENAGVVGYAIPSHLDIDTSSQGSNPSADPDEVVVEKYKATVAVASLPVYKSASTSSKLLGTLPAGYAVTVYAQNGSWAYIGKGSNYGFCSLSGLQRNTGMNSDGLTGTIPVTVTASSVKVYKSASTSSTKLGTLSKGAQVNLISTEGSWAYIELNGKYGYCAVSALTSQSAASGDAGEVIDGRSPLGTTTVIHTSAKVYASKSTSAASTTLKMGETLSFYGYDSTWVLVGRDGVFGFMLREDLSAENYSELKLEDSGAGVVQLETALLALGYLDTVPSSNYTAITAQGVQRLQAALGISQSGSANQALLRVLYSGNAPASPLLSLTLSSGSKNDNVSRLQKRLLALGYLSRESSADGSYGTNTANAVRLFQTAAGITATGTADSATIRALYSASAPQLPTGQTAPDQATTGGTTSGSSGNTTNIPAGLASTTSSYNSGMSNAQKLEYVIYLAQQQLGKKYVFGSSGPNTFDCSGLMLYCFKQIGITLQHSAQGEGYNDRWTKISSISSLRRGDMVFFDTVSDADLCDHVGIYLGSNYFLHAGSGAGKVIISTLSSGYYNRVFSWGRRVLA